MVDGCRNIYENNCVTGIYHLYNTKLLVFTPVLFSLLADKQVLIIVDNKAFMFVGAFSFFLIIMFYIYVRYRS